MDRKNLLRLWIKEGIFNLELFLDKGAVPRDIQDTKVLVIAGDRMYQEYRKFLFLELARLTKAKKKKQADEILSLIDNEMEFIDELSVNAVMMYKDYPNLEEIDYMHLRHGLAELRKTLKERGIEI